MITACRDFYATVRGLQRTETCMLQSGDYSVYRYVCLSRKYEVHSYQTSINVSNFTPPQNLLIKFKSSMTRSPPDENLLPLFVGSVIISYSQ